MTVSRLTFAWLVLVALCLSLAGFAFGTAEHFLPEINSRAFAGKQPDGSWLVVTQQVLRPWREQHFIKGRPVDLAFNATKSKLAILNLDGIELMDEDSGAQEQIKTRSTSYCGIAFRPGDHELWASEADPSGEGSLFVGTLAADGGLAREQRIVFPGKAFPAGIAFSSDGLRAFVALNNRNKVAVVDAATKSVLREIHVGLAPFLVKLSPDGTTLYVSNRGGDAPLAGGHQGFSSGTAMATDATTGAVLNGTVTVVRLADFTSRQVPVGRAPTSLAVSADGATVAVANSHSDSVSLIDAVTLHTTTVAIPTLPDGLLGTAPVSVVFSADSKRLYVAAALNNSVVVLEKRDSSYVQAGAIPAGWFPGALALDRNQDIVVLNVKGDGNTENGKGGHILTRDR